MKELVLGLDIGTQGARVLVTDLEGNLYAGASKSFEKLNLSEIAGHKEQEPEDWWNAAAEAIGQCIQELKQNGIQPEAIRAMSLDATSGTVLALDGNNHAMTKGLMYNDGRADAQAKEIGKYAKTMEEMLGYKVNSSFGLSKILWLQENLAQKPTRYVHQSDFLIGKLTGLYDVSDCSNALKSCYDVVEKRWPDFIAALGIQQSQLPRVLLPGEQIAKICPQAAAQTGLSTETVVVAGATDGYASALSAGISESGDYASIIGTTLVMKGIEEKLIVDPQGRIYSHLHPQGFWLLGGASNVGGRCLNDNFDRSQFDTFNQSVPVITPTNLPCYPLFDDGERFPFVNAQARGFLGDFGGDDRVKYTLLMEGVGYAERLSFDMLTDLGCQIKDEIFTAGGACKSDEWLQIRADILSKTLKIPEQTDAVMGSALLASLQAGYATLKEASDRMVRIKKVVYPSAKAGQYEEGYEKTKQELRERGYIQ